MNTFWSLVFILSSFFLLKYRERVGDMLGEASWMSAVGGVYVLVALIAVIFFFWGLAGLTGTYDVLLSPLRWILPI